MSIQQQALDAALLKYFCVVDTAMKPRQVSYRDIARSDVISCQKMRGGWLCSLVQNHDGAHVACCFVEGHGKVDEVVAIWEDE